mmetsp:Transcript_8224/g.24394  ORF Transcript_8224/g.24394 Transcript_8224/m.24394 type:complete len:218 (-) Transcript_8224:612-1265(-)
MRWRSRAASARARELSALARCSASWAADRARPSASVARRSAVSCAVFALYACCAAAWASRRAASKSRFAPSSSARVRSRSRLSCVSREEASWRRCSKAEDRHLEFDSSLRSSGCGGGRGARAAALEDGWGGALPAWLKGFAIGLGWGGCTSGRGGTRWSGRGCARWTGAAAAEPQGAAETGAAFWPVVRFVTDVMGSLQQGQVVPCWAFMTVWARHC